MYWIGLRIIYIFSTKKILVYEYRSYTYLVIYLDIFRVRFSEKECEGEYALEVEKRNKMRTVFITGRDGLTPQQAAVLLVQEARMLIQVYIILKFYK